MRVILVDHDRCRADAVAQALKEPGDVSVLRIERIEGLMAAVNQHGPDVVVVNLRAVTAEVLDYLASLNRHYPLPVVIFADEMDGGVITAVVEAGVAAYVVDGLQNHRIKFIIDTAIVRFRKYRLLEEELLATKHLLTERKVVERAKGILMKQRGCSEDEAYHILRRQAMSKNKKLVDVAEGLISAAELLV